MKKNPQKLQLSSLLGIILVLLAFTSCQKEEITGEASNQTRFEELASRFSREMPQEEFFELYGLLSTMVESTAAKPTPIADVSNLEYQITYSNQVRIEIGGAVYFEDREVVEGGTTVGGVYLPPSLYEQLDGSAPHQIRLRIRDPFDWVQNLLGLRQVVMTVLDQGNAVYYGLYNVNTTEYLFLNVAGEGGNVGNTACGAIGLGRVYGKTTAPYTSLAQGDVGYGFIAGCGPVLIGASITFFYTGVELQ